ncbi:MAG: WYL domain-containing protein [Rhodoferax sp.]|nr:WYL domain-containing protein [Rhodoferax sp.]
MVKLLPQDGLDDATGRTFGSTEFSKHQTRHLKILNQLTAIGRPMSTHELWEVVGKGEVTERQLQRDLKKMATHYGLDCNPSGRSNVWSIPKGSSPRYVLPVLDQNAALAFHLAEGLLEEILPDHLVGALNPWVAESRNLLAQKNSGNPWYERLTAKREGIQLDPPVVDAGVLAAVYAALQAKEQLKFMYTKPGDVPAVRTVSPAGIVASNQTLYLLAYSADHEDYTTYAMQRISQAQRNYTPATLPNVDDFLDYVDWGFNEFYASDDEIALVVDFDPTVQHKMLEYALADDQQTQLLSDQWLRVSATVYDTGSLQAWLLSYGNRVRVIAPAALVAALDALRQPAPPPPAG